MGWDINDMGMDQDIFSFSLLLLLLLPWWWWSRYRNLEIQPIASNFCWRMSAGLNETHTESLTKYEVIKFCWKLVKNVVISVGFQRILVREWYYNGMAAHTCWASEICSWVKCLRVAQYLFYDMSFSWISCQVSSGSRHLQKNHNNNLWRGWFSRDSSCI